MERRSNKRFDASGKYTARLIHADQIRIKNISLGGLCVETSNCLIPNEVYKIELVLLNNEKITPDCVMVWTSLKGAVKAGDATLPLHEAGLKFINLQDSEKEFLEKFIEELTRESKKTPPI